MRKYDEMRREAEVFVDLTKNTFPLVRKATDAWLAYVEDDKQTVRNLLPEIEARLNETPWDEVFVASLRFYLGEADKGFELLERAYSKRKPSLLGLKGNELMEGVKSDPRYLGLLKRIGLD